MRPVNLLPYEQRRRAPREAAAGGGKGAYGVLAVLTVLLALVAAYVLTSNQVTDNQNQTAAAKTEADRLEAKAALAADYVDFAAIAEQRVASVAGVAEARFDWERFMRELSRIMPEGSWLQSSDASVTGALGTAETTAPAPAAAAVGPSATLVGCTPHQSDVAALMVRLRQLHRVNDVELIESVQEQAGQLATFESCGRLYSFELTLSFDATQPASEAPPGASRVPASLGGGS